MQLADFMADALMANEVKATVQLVLDRRSFRNGPFPSATWLAWCTLWQCACFHPAKHITSPFPTATSDSTLRLIVPD